MFTVPMVVDLVLIIFIWKLHNSKLSSMKTLKENNNLENKLSPHSTEEITWPLKGNSHSSEPLDVLHR